MKQQYKKTCPVCGKSYLTPFKRQVCCSRECAGVKQHSSAPRRPHRGGRHSLSTFGATAAERQELKARATAEFERRARLAKRDLEYRDCPYAAPVTVEERGGRVIETRGQACIGWRSAGHISHNS